MHWLQLRINTQRENAPAVENSLLDNGALSITLEDNADEAIFEPGLGETPLWSQTRVTGLFDAAIDTTATLDNIMKECAALNLSGRWHILEDKDWQREWMKHLQPIQCGQRLWVCPSWVEPPDPNAINLMLDPGLAFGTGTHPTTFLCLQWLARTPLEGMAVVDYGCGSGILGIAAILLGAHTVVGVDIDPQAIVASRQNVTRNQLETADFSVYLPHNIPDIAADIVLANILAAPLVELADTLIRLLEPGGKICLSGILASQKQAIVDAYRHRINIESITAMDGWLCISGAKQ